MRNSGAHQVHHHDGRHRHRIALALVRDAAELLDTVDPGTAILHTHGYGDVTVRTRRVVTERRDALTLIVHPRGDHCVAAAIVVTRTVSTR